jgi:hypothetical protein
MHERARQKTSFSGVPENRLYVVLHGLVCLIEDPAKDFTGYLIDRGHEHVYVAGNFGTEKPIGSNQVLTLVNVTPGAKRLDPTKNAVLSKAQPKRGSVFDQSSIILPRPDDILHFVCGLVVDGLTLVDPNTELAGPPTFISGTRVFQYTFTDFNKVQLVAHDGSVFWQCPRPTVVGNLAVAVLEVYNEPPHDLGTTAAAHNKKEFNDSLLFIQAKKVQLLTPGFFPQDVDSLPPGLTEDQVCSLDVRSVVIAHLKGKKTKGSDFAAQFGKNEDGGGGGTQVCGGANGILG